MQHILKKTSLKGVSILCALTLAGAVQATGVPGQGTWETSLQARDLDGNLANGPEAFYDAYLDVTWLRAGSTNAMYWDTAKTWAANLNVNGVTDWRLPTVIDTGTTGCNFSYSGGTDCGFNVQTKSGSPTQYQAGQTVYSEMAHLFYVTLGNKAYYAPGTGATQAGYGMTNTGNFQNLQSNTYWSGTEYAPDSVSAWYFSTNVGNQGIRYKDGSFNALAVRPGDVTAAVPEPQTWALALVGLTGVLLARRRRAL
jgi:MYXO-CTERM domain-containing protein